MKILNLNDDIKLRHKLENIVFDNFDNYTLSSLNHILSFIVDDIIDVIDNNNEFDVELIEIYYDNLIEFIKDNLKHIYQLYNIIPIYKNDELINLIHVNNLFDPKIDNNNIIQYNSIMNLLNDYHELIYDINKNEFDDILLNDKFDNDDVFELFYNIENYDDKYKLNYYCYFFNNDVVYIEYNIINKFELIKLFYKYIDDIVENIVDDIVDDIKRYYKGSLLI